MLLNRCGKYLR